MDPVFLGWTYYSEHFQCNQNSNKLQKTELESALLEFAVFIELKDEPDCCEECVYKFHLDSPNGLLKGGAIDDWSRQGFDLGDRWVRPSEDPWKEGEFDLEVYAPGSLGWKLCAKCYHAITW